jgi:hypothetical protein
MIRENTKVNLVKNLVKRMINTPQTGEERQNSEKEDQKAISH